MARLIKRYESRKLYDTEESRYVSLDELAELARQCSSDVEDLRLLLPLLREAREARRVVVITADHGHLLEDGTTQVSNGSESDRWRAGTDSRAPHEVAVSGGRVVTSDGSNTVVCLWGESTRYGGRKNGYHGGLSPQEVTVPLSVLPSSSPSLR